MQTFRILGLGPFTGTLQQLVAEGLQREKDQFTLEIELLPMVPDLAVIYTISPNYLF